MKTVRNTVRDFRIDRSMRSNYSLLNPYDNPVLLELSELQIIDSNAEVIWHQLQEE